MDRFISSAITVGKIILVAAMGIFVSRYFGNKSKSLQAISHISVKIFLPSLLLTQLARDLSWEMIFKYYWACILPLFPMFIGLLTAILFRSFIPSEFHGLFQLACTFQNVISFGLGVVMNLNLPWYDAQASKEAQAYVFLFNVVHSLFLWSVGTMIIEKCAMEQEEKREQVVISGNAKKDSPSRYGTSHSDLEHATQSEDMCYRPVTCLEDYRPQVVKPNMKAKKKPDKDLSWGEYIMLQLSYLLTEQLIASFCGLLIALCPPVHFLFDNPVGEIVLGGFSMLAPGTVPLQLLVLGVNITADGDGSIQLPLRFVVGVIALRLFIIPLIGFGIIHALIVSALMPHDRPFVLTMLVLMCAPTAINTSIICSIYSYRVKEYTKLLLFMYITCIFTTTLWLTVFVWYIDLSF